MRLIVVLATILLVAPAAADDSRSLSHSEDSLSLRVSSTGEDRIDWSFSVVTAAFSLQHTSNETTQGSFRMARLVEYVDDGDGRYGLLDEVVNAQTLATRPGANVELISDSAGVLSYRATLPLEAGPEPLGTPALIVDLRFTDQSITLASGPLSDDAMALDISLRDLQPTRPGSRYALVGVVSGDDVKVNAAAQTVAAGTGSTRLVLGASDLLPQALLAGHETAGDALAILELDRNAPRSMRYGAQAVDLSALVDAIVGDWPTFTIAMVGAGLIAGTPVVLRLRQT